MPISDLPVAIQDHILRNANGTGEKEPYQHMPNGMSITELLYCLRKSYYIRKNPKPHGIESAFNLYRGKVFDNLWSPLFKRNQIRCTHRVKNFPISISGKFDWLEDDTVTDLKTAKTLYFTNEPSEEYKKQVRFYAYCNALDKAQIVYIDFGDCKVFPVEVGDCSKLIEEIESKAIQLWHSLRTDKPPPKISTTQTWICEKCEYKEECAKD